MPAVTPARGLPAQRSFSNSDSSQPTIDVPAEDRAEVSFSFRELRDETLMIVADVKTTRERGPFVSRSFNVGTIRAALSRRPVIETCFPMTPDTYELMFVAIRKFITATLDGSPWKCAACGCTDDDCQQCLNRTGKPCHWIGRALCSACGAEGGAA